MSKVINLIGERAPEYEPDEWSSEEEVQEVMLF